MTTSKILLSLASSDHFVLPEHPPDVLKTLASVHRLQPWDRRNAFDTCGNTNASSSGKLWLCWRRGEKTVWQVDRNITSSGASRLNVCNKAGGSSSNNRKALYIVSLCLLLFCTVCSLKTDSALSSIEHVWTLSHVTSSCLDLLVTVTHVNCPLIIIVFFPHGCRAPGWKAKKESR